MGDGYASREDGTEDPREHPDAFDDGWLMRGIEAALFGGGHINPAYRVRAAAFLGKEECLPDRVGRGPMIDGAQRGRIAAAFREAFPEGGGTVPTEFGDGDVLGGAAFVEAPDQAAAWILVVRKLRGFLTDDGGIPDAEAAFSALDFVHVEVSDEGWEDLVARALGNPGEGSPSEGPESRNPERSGP